MAGSQLTSFEHILLGLVCMSPASGYDLKRIFASSPMGVYQPSSGALYPALRRLEDKRLVRPRASQTGTSARPRHVFEVTQAGRAAHLEWLHAPVEPASVSRDLGLHLMRFVMMENVLPPGEVLAFLHDLADGLASFTAELERHAASGGPAGRHPRLAVDHGIAVHRASLRWALHAIATLSADDAAAE